MDRWILDAYRPAIISSAGGSGQIPVSLTAKVRKCDLVMEGVINVTLDGKEWPKHHRQRSAKGGGKHTGYYTLNVALTETWKFQRAALRCPKRAPKTMPLNTRKLIAFGKLMPGAGGSNRTPELPMNEIAGRVLRAKSLPAQFKGKGTFSWRLRTDQDELYSDFFGEGSEGKEIGFDGSTYDDTWMLPRPHVILKPRWGPPLDQVPDCGPGYCGRQPCCRAHVDLE